MTCAQIGAELEPMAMAMAGLTSGMQAELPGLQAKAAAAEAEGRARGAQAMACFAARAATMGAPNPACAAIEAANDARDRAREPVIAADSKRVTGVAERDMAALQAGAAQLDQPRVQRLMALAEQENCQ